MKNFEEITKDISESLKVLGKEIPETLQGFATLASAAKKEGVLDTKTKELIAMAIGVAARCDGCIGFHAKELVELGATVEELSETLVMVVYMGGGPSLMYAGDALKAFDQFSKEN